MRIRCSSACSPIPQGHRERRKQQTSVEVGSLGKSPCQAIRNGVGRSEQERKREEEGLGRGGFLLMMGLKF